MRTPRRDFWMRIVLMFTMFMSVFPFMFIDNVSLLITLPITVFIWAIMTLGMLWYVRQLDPIVNGIIRICEACCRFLFVCAEGEVINERTMWCVTDERTEWCKENIPAFWFSFNGNYYFLRQVDAMGFKLAWI